MSKKLVKTIEIVVMNGGGWNACVPGGPWATDVSPEAALALLLSRLEHWNYKLATDNREERKPT